MTPDEQMREVVRDQLDHITASHAVDRRGWIPQQWIDDARRLMGDLDGSVLDLVNGHVLRMLDALTEKDAKIVARNIEIERLRNQVLHMIDKAADPPWMRIRCDEELLDTILDALRHDMLSPAVRHRAARAVLTALREAGEQP